MKQMAYSKQLCFNFDKTSYFLLHTNIHYFKYNLWSSQDSAVDTITSDRLDHSGAKSQQGKKLFFFSSNILTAHEVQHDFY
jgi:hypothetical protein